MMWRQQPGCMEMFLTYYEDLKRRYPFNMRYRDFLIHVLSHHERQAELNGGLVERSQNSPLSSQNRVIQLPADSSPVLSSPKRRSLRIQHRGGNGTQRVAKCSCCQEPEQSCEVEKPRLEIKLNRLSVADLPAHKVKKPANEKEPGHSPKRPREKQTHSPRGSPHKYDSPQPGRKAEKAETPQKDGEKESPVSEVEDVPELVKEEEEAWEVVDVGDEKVEGDGKAAATEEREDDKENDDDEKEAAGSSSPSQRKRQGKVCQQLLKKAMRACAQGMSYGAVARTYSIPYFLLYRNFRKQKRQLDQRQRALSRVLSVQQETELLSTMRRLMDGGFPVTGAACREMAYDLGKHASAKMPSNWHSNGAASREWLSHFVQNHSAQLGPHWPEEERQKDFAEVAGVAKSYSPSAVFSADVLELPSGARRAHFAIIVYMDAAGRLGDPFLVFRHDEPSSVPRPDLGGSGMVLRPTVAVTRSGRIDRAVFMAFLKHFDQRTASEGAKRVVFVDPRNVRLSYPALQLCEKRNIDLRGLGADVSGHPIAGHLSALLLRQWNQAKAKVGVRLDGGESLDIAAHVAVLDKVWKVIGERRCLMARAFPLCGIHVAAEDVDADESGDAGKRVEESPPSKRRKKLKLEGSEEKASKPNGVKCPGCAESFEESVSEWFECVDCRRWSCEMCFEIDRCLRCVT